MKNDMNRQEILDRLRENERALRERGVTHAALFGSRARGDERPDSDTDILIDVDPEARITVYDYVGLKEFIAGLFDGGVDVVNREGLKPTSVPPRRLTPSMPSEAAGTPLCAAAEEELTRLGDPP
jgi:predicted nucleotidyltransferase